VAIIIYYHEKITAYHFSLKQRNIKTYSIINSAMSEDIVIINVLERELDALKGPRVIEWAHEVRIGKPTHLRSITGYLVFEYSNWTGKMTLDIRIESSGGKVYFDKEYRVLNSTMKTAISKGKDSRKISIPIGVRTSEPPVLKIKIRSEASTGWFKFTITELKVIVE